MSKSLQEWIEAALIVADSNGMSDDQVIPTWPKDVADHYPDLTVGALREFEVARVRGSKPLYFVQGPDDDENNWRQVPKSTVELQKADSFFRDYKYLMLYPQPHCGRAFEGDSECREFAKLYRFAGLGQVLVVLDTGGDEKADALITFQFWPGVDGLGICSTHLGFIDDEGEDAAGKAERAFAELTAEMAERIVGETARKIRESWDGADNSFEESGDE